MFLYCHGSAEQREKLLFLLVERQWNKDGEWHGSEKEESKNEE